ncbi:MAG: hypothetical protein QW548_00255 [Candidatus Aenigmatarchaeota archaeon]
MLHWFVFNFLVLLTCAFVILEKSLEWDISLLLPLAWLLLAVTALLIAKDALLMR